MPSLDLASLPSDYHSDAVPDSIPADNSYCMRTIFETQVCKIAATQFPEDKNPPANHQ